VKAPHRAATAARGEAVDREVTLYIGGVHASGAPTVIKTLLGSCIAVCLWDPVRRAGGMNHFLLPDGGGAVTDLTRFGVHAMDVLIGATMNAGADRRRLVAKVFGGAHVLDIGEGDTSVARRNIAFVREYLEAEGFPVIGADVGGYEPRHVHFYTATGRARVKRVGHATMLGRLARRERAEATRPAVYGDVTLYDSDSG
jgi:chemotaxis receptor (MCP) glutamine deamidase CheD